MFSHHLTTLAFGHPSLIRRGTKGVVDYMPRINNLKIYKGRRRELRNSATPQEIILWSKISNSQLGFKFRRQHSIGNYIVDFYCPEAKLVIEIDGSEHLKQADYDNERTEYLLSTGCKVLRFWNNEINKNLEEVIMKIEEELEKSSQPPRLADSAPLLIEEGN